DNKLLEDVVGPSLRPQQFVELFARPDRGGHRLRVFIVQQARASAHQLYQPERCGHETTDWAELHGETPGRRDRTDDRPRRQYRPDRMAPDCPPARHWMVSARWGAASTCARGT